MGLPSKYRRFFIILFELFLVLKLYEAWHRYTGLDIGSFFMLAFVFFWLLNWLLGNAQLTRAWQSTIISKIFPRFKFSNDWFGILVAGAIVSGFFVAQWLSNDFASGLLIIALGYVAYRLKMKKKSLIKHSWGVVVLGTIFGLAFGSSWTSIPVIITIFAIGHIAMYLSSQPGEH